MLEFDIDKLYLSSSTGPNTYPKIKTILPFLTLFMESDFFAEFPWSSHFDVFSATGVELAAVIRVGAESPSTSSVKH